MAVHADLFITCARGFEDLLAMECAQQGIDAAQQRVGGVECGATLEQAYRLCLWSRVGSRVLLKLQQFCVDSYDALYGQARDIDWSAHMHADTSLAIDCHSNDSVLNNSHFAMLRVKDAIVDRLRRADGQRPDIVRQQPDIRINVYLYQGRATVYLDLSGEALHKRGYRQDSAAAPLRETLAAAMLYRAKWPQLAQQGKPLVDCMCGTGTLLIEAAMMAANQPPALQREHFGFLAWKQHDESLWQQCLQQAREQQRDQAPLPLIQGYDISARAIAQAQQQCEAAGFTGQIHLQTADCRQTLPDVPTRAGLMICNPPYGKRLGEIEQLKDLYFRLGQRLKAQFGGWQASVLTPVTELAQCIGLRSHHQNSLYNGALKCTLYHYAIHEPRELSAATEQPEHENVQAFRNRLAKNLKHLQKWARRNQVSCYRLYDADIPQYAVAIDRYEDEVLIYEYQAPKSVHAGKSMRRLNDVIEGVQQLLQLPRERIVVKTRKKQSGAAQYRPLDDKGRSKIVTENGLRFQVNLHDYLDTGLFLDHRDTRKRVMQMCAGKHMLNLFAYTGSFTVYAAAGGAASTTTVDLSNTYLDWAKANMKLNRLLDSRHGFIRDDCLQWMRQQQGKRFYDVIVLDPPTFSNSKRMEDVLDIQRDHVSLIRLAMGLLTEQGSLLFSTNARRFRLDEAALGSCQIREISAQTLTEDFKRRPAHRCWLVTAER